ncbi:MAG TPA: DUF4932 domain-containing protein [Candidatus Angelobacter sp.]|nr:DUF4932 domain-containing protein [Candidatus Angelobacter sp.]
MLICPLIAVFSTISSSQSTKAQLEVSETLFSITAALNSCGYNAGLDNSMPVRQAVRADMEKAVQQSAEAAKARNNFCQFQLEHQPVDVALDASQYLSLGLDLGSPPSFNPLLLEADLPPDAAHVLGMIPLLQKLYQATGMHEIWQRHRAEYNGLVDQFHDQVSDAIRQMDLYLKLPFSNEPGRRFVIYLEPMLSPGQINARNYENNYYVVVAPGKDGSASTLRLEEVRHTYLHYVLDPMALRHAANLKRLEPLAELVKSSPLDASYRFDMSLLVNESLIRAIEARTLFDAKSNAAARSNYVQHSMEEGFILTKYFYDALANFEKESTGLKDAYGNLLYNISLDQERKRVRDVVFAAKVTPEVVGASKHAMHEQRFLDVAEQQLSSGDPASAQKLALQVLNNPNSTEDPGRALFILARSATLSGDMKSALSYFQKAVDLAHDPRTLAWSHIYLGRIFDIQENRDQALQHYRAALDAGDFTPDTKAAAEKGLASPYAPPQRPH